jgi:hypothetical protein
MGDQRQKRLQDLGLIHVGDEGKVRIPARKLGAERLHRDHLVLGCRQQYVEKMVMAQGLAQGVDIQRLPKPGPALALQIDLIGFAPFFRQRRPLNRKAKSQGFSGQKVSWRQPILADDGIRPNRFAKDLAGKAR